MVYAYGGEFARRMISGLETAWKNKDDPHKFGGKIYYAYVSYVNSELRAPHPKGWGFQ